jgi:hypothetical protein
MHALSVITNITSEGLIMRCDPWGSGCGSDGPNTAP